MTPERWQQIKYALDEALALAADARLGYLDRIGVCDPDLRKEIEALLAEDELAGSRFLNLPASALFFAPGRFVGRQLGPYRLVETIGTGGMAEVYRAVRADAEYEQQVAVKLVRTGRDLGLLIARLRSERQILATLEHPHIARLLDGGTTEDGIPYLVMELIDGQPITTYCDEHCLDTGARLELFLHVCSAVQYAHQRMVIHRDLKPSNILVTRDGVPKLLDFGIAKILEAGAVPTRGDVTVATMRVLTPQYASPEQVRGEPVTAASDVYSLGVVLYELLTRLRPYPESTAAHEAADAVLARVPKKPSAAVLESAHAAHARPVRWGGVLQRRVDVGAGRLSARLKGDLDNIVLMALREVPTRRYATVEQLAEDIRRHLRHSPVRARKPTLGYRASSFIARHSVGVGATVLIVVALIGGIVMTAREAHLAELQRSRAERRFNDLRELAHALMFEIHDSIQELPGSTPTRKLLVARALKYLDSLRQEAGGDPVLLREVAAAYKRMGDVLGYQYRANLGDTAGALQSYRKNLSIRESLAASSASSEDARRLAEAYRMVGEMLGVSNDLQGSLRNLRRALELGEIAAHTYPYDFELLAELTDAYEATADALSGYFNSASLADNAGAVPYRRKALQLNERLLGLKPQDPELQRRSALATVKMGDVLLLDGLWREADDYYLRAKKIFEELTTALPDNSTLPEQLNALYTRVETLKKMQGDLPGALAIDRTALRVSQQLSAKDPQNVQARLSMAIDYSNLADSAAASGVNREALRAMSAALHIVEEVVALSPKNAEFRGVQASLYETAGDVYRASGDDVRALRSYRRSVEIVAQSVAEDPANADARLRFAGFLNSEAAALASLHEVSAATAAYDKALQLAQADASSAHPNEQALYSTADSYGGLGQVEALLAGGADSRAAEREHWQKACSWYRRSLEAWGSVKEPGLMSPDGHRVTPMSTIAHRLEHCESALARLPQTPLAAGSRD